LDVVDDSPSDWDFVRNARTDIPALCRDLLAAREALQLIAHRCADPELRSVAQAALGGKERVK